MDTFADYIPAAASDPGGRLAGPGSVGGGMPPNINPDLSGLRSMHPGASPTPWVIALAVGLVLLLHPKAGFQAGAHAKVG